MKLPSEEFLKTFKSTNGALSVSESIAIMNIASEAPEGTYMELGTFHGKSGMSATRSLKPGIFYLVDPIFEDTALSNQVNLLVATPEICTCTIANYSTNVIDKYGPYAYVFVDSGSHQDGLPMQEVKMLEDRMVAGGIIAFHDCFAQFIEVTKAYEYLLSTGKYEEVSIPWDQIRAYVGENNLEVMNLSWHHVDNPFPCFVGAVRRKV
jgi:hypothetical protein